MPPKETTTLLSKSSSGSKITDDDLDAMIAAEYARSETLHGRAKHRGCKLFAVGAILVLLVTVYVVRVERNVVPPSGEYHLVECQEGQDFFKFYSFYDGPDSLGSAGYNNYVSKQRAFELGIAHTEQDPATGKESVIVGSVKTEENSPRESVRLEGNRRFDHGLFIMDLDHMPAGCGVWPAFWLTDENDWPRNGEVDVIEGINRQPMAKTALHTSDQCSMYAHVPRWSWSGEWDTATGLPDTFTGEPNFENRVEADNCWVMAPHQWANQGCVAVDTRNNTLGAPLNAAGGGVYVLEWDPAHQRIRSWAFPRSEGIPENLQGAIDTASETDESLRITPDSNEWGLPYAYFAIGEATGCSADHFQNMRIVINLAFCGTVAGNRFLRDCPEMAKMNLTDKKHEGDPWKTCNAYIESNPEALKEAYWKIRGAYVYQRGNEVA